MADSVIDAQVQNSSNPAENLTRSGATPAATAGTVDSSHFALVFEVASWTLDIVLAPVSWSFSCLKWVGSFPTTVTSCFIGTFLFVTAVMLRGRRKARIEAHGAMLPSDSRNVASGRTVTVGFFHPYCNAGGGGERVLWCAIRSLQNRYDFVKCVVYTGDTDVSGEQILRLAEERFNITLKREVRFVFLHCRPWVTAKRYPVFTLLGQSIGSIILGMEALWKFSPDIFIDSMGYAFTLPLFKYLGGSKVSCYVHYPTISTDMLSKVAERRVDFNNAGLIAGNRILSSGKLLYYKFFAYLYGVVGRCADVVMVNSTWTQNHINSLWKIPSRTSVVYPPCDTKSLLDICIDADESMKVLPRKILSVGQFRPEKNHSLQLQSFKRFLDTRPRNQKGGYELILLGSCRGVEDDMRVVELKKEAKKLKIDQFVQFEVNVPYDELVSHLMESTIGIHTMKDEHFGIGIVELMAAGVIPVAHKSGGPLMDIVIDWDGGKTGYLADTADSYATAIGKIFSKSSQERFEMALRARECVKKRFSEDTFKRRFLSATEALLV